MKRIIFISAMTCEQGTMALPSFTQSIAFFLSCVHLKGQLPFLPGTETSWSQ